MGTTLSQIQSWIDESPQKVEILGRTNRERQCQEVLGISEQAVLGALVNETGGMMAANGRIRHWGGPNAWGLSLEEVNLVQDGLPTRIPGVLITAADVFGGLFGISLGTENTRAGTMLYLPPEDYQWIDLQVGHTAFFRWTLSGQVDAFYRDFDRFVQADRTPAFGKVLAFTPPLWSADLISGQFRLSQMDARSLLTIRAQMLEQL